MQKAKQKIQEIISKTPCKIFSAKDFDHIANINVVRSILHKLTKKGEISRIMHGLYTKPYYIDIVDEYSYPSVDEVVQKLAQKFNWTIAPGGEATLNYTGVSNQVSNVYIYVSDGPSREYIYRGRKISFKHTNKKYIKQRSSKFAVLIEAIQRIGKRDLNDKRIKKLTFFAQNIEEDLLKDTSNIIFWIRNALLKIKEINEINKFFNLPEEKRKRIILNTEEKLKISPSITEKDLWVCIILKYLFNDFKYKDYLVFKGGTSLSKAYNLIERFSEDIDLSLDWRVLGYPEKDPYKPRSNTKQDKYNEELYQKTSNFLKN
ncbi:Nucleotidyl transferase of uncharacterised function (DUF1814) [Mycoplasmopsis citelli]|uniref:Nucleotidyl transferase of uncharacterized function (DUF1814) n=1 Tax=Mycoplasmopsis citelli TaxID=171281 RepID=A0A449B126_9BACT|nr:DUF6088 family protein [Mycoplasmopsis citelli]VEU74245.1 Nucleotidyl transferase of uncharacterised function (DUF1814) [Mycoplasmopsis citelli]